MSSPERYYKGFNGEKIPIKTKNPNKELTPNELKIYRYLRTLGAGRTEKQIHKIFHDMATVGNRLRGLRQKGYVRSIPQRRGEQKWEARL